MADHGSWLFEKHLDLVLGGLLDGEFRHLLQLSCTLGGCRVERLSVYTGRVAVHNRDLHHVEKRLPPPLTGLSHELVEYGKLISLIHPIHTVVIGIQHCRIADCCPSSCGDDDWLCLTTAAQNYQWLFSSIWPATQEPTTCRLETPEFHRRPQRAVCLR